MKIAQIVCSFPPYPGGIGQSAWRLGEILSEEHQVDTFTLSQDKEKLKPVDSHQKIIYLRPWIRIGHGALPFSLLWRLRKYDCLYLHYPFFGATEIIKLFFKIFPRKKLIIHYHMDTPNLSFSKKLLAWPAKFSQKFLLKKAVKVIVSSLDYVQAGNLKQYLNKSPQKFIELPFGIDIEIFKPRLDKNHPSSFAKKTVKFIRQITKQIINKGECRLLFVGGLDQAHYFKGLKNLLKALAGIKEKKWRLNIIGDGNQRNDYEKLSRILGMSKQINFRGRVSNEDLLSYYRHSDILILPSINAHEAFGLVLIEALACGLPVIASNLPGVRSVFNDGQEGLYVRPNDIDDLRTKIKFLINQDARRQEMSLAGRQLALDRYDQNKIADRLLDEFSRLSS